MDNEFLASFEKFELIAFFSGYALIYVLLNGVLQGERIFGASKTRLFSLSYQLTATLFLGYTVRKLVMGSLDGVQTYFYHPLLYLFGLLSIFFWLPPLYRRSVIMLFHSLVFFSLIPLDIIFYFRGMADRSQVRNDMNMLGLGLSFNVFITVVAFLILWLSERMHKRPAE